MCNLLLLVGFNIDCSKPWSTSLCLEGDQSSKRKIFLERRRIFPEEADVNDHGQVSPDTVVQVWRGGFRKELAKVTQKGFQSVLSSCWYLNRIHFGRDWPTIYQCDPHDFNGTTEQKNLVLGGEMCMWGEFIDGTNLISRTWPRGCAVAERLWSSVKVQKVSAATPRLEEQRCRMIRRGLNAEPVSGPGRCHREYKPHL